MQSDLFFLDSKNKSEAERVLVSALKLGIDFKLDNAVRKKCSGESLASLAEDKPLSSGQDIYEVLNYFKEKVLPESTNFSSPNFMGFPDAGNSLAGIAGGVLALFLQQNLINQSFCAPSGTFIEASMIKWAREKIGYTPVTHYHNPWDLGGVVTTGGTLSNTMGIMLARENKSPATMQNGITSLNNFKIIVPKGIYHYSVKSAQMWLGCGNQMIEVETQNFKYDLRDLERVLKANKGQIMALIAYAGDSRMMSVDNFQGIHDVVKSIDDSIWLHADACHGYCLAFTQSHKRKLKGIELFDSVTTDPHKVFNIPYVLSMFLVKEPQKLRMISSYSDLIMNEHFSFGQTTPFLGSKEWMSLKLWFMAHHLGDDGIAKILDERLAMAQYLHTQLTRDNRFIVMNDCEINSVAFLYKGGLSTADLEVLNKVQDIIHERILAEGKIHLHHFSIPDAGKISKGVIVRPLRYMGGNPNTTRENIDTMISYVIKIGEDVIKTFTNAISN